MNKAPSPEEQEFLNTLFDLYIQRRNEKNISPNEVASFCDVDTWNLTRDEKRRAPPAFLTMRRKCKAAGLCIGELTIEAEKITALRIAEQKKKK